MAMPFAGGSGRHLGADPLLGLPVPTEAELARARGLRRRILVADRRDQLLVVLPALVTTAFLVVVLLAVGRMALGMLGVLTPFGDGADSHAAGTVFGLSLGLTKLTVAGALLALTVVAHQLLLPKYLRARPRRPFATFVGRVLPRRITPNPVLQSSPGLAVLLVVDACRDIHPERIAEVLDLPLPAVEAWIAELASRVLVRRVRFGTWNVCAVSDLGEQTLDRVLGPAGSRRA